MRAVPLARLIDVAGETGIGRYVAYKVSWLATNRWFR